MKVRILAVILMASLLTGCSASNIDNTEETNGDLLTNVASTLEKMSYTLDEIYPDTTETNLAEKMWLEDKIETLATKAMVSQALFGEDFLDNIGLTYKDEEISYPIKVGDLVEKIGGSINPSRSIPGYTSSYGIRLSDENEKRINSVGAVNPTKDTLKTEDCWLGLTESIDDDEIALIEKRRIANSSNRDYDDIADDEVEIPEQLCINNIKMGDSLETVFDKLNLTEGTIEEKQAKFSQSLGTLQERSAAREIYQIFDAGANWEVGFKVYACTGVEQYSQIQMIFRGSELNGVEYYSIDFTPFSREELLKTYKSLAGVNQ